MTEVKAILGDITKQSDVDAIVNAAKEYTVFLWIGLLK